MGKRALVITYHVKNCRRVGGFHFFIEYLEKLSYEIDWVPCPVSLSWAFHRNDRENLKNFMDLWRGITFEENGVRVRHFSSPVFIPAKMAAVLGMEKSNHYWPSWKTLRRKLKPEYDVILVEGVGCQYASELKRDYPKARIIYRPSDILETFSNVPHAADLEKKMIETADMTVCVDENQQNYYKDITGSWDTLGILRNPLACRDDLEFLRHRKLDRCRSHKEGAHEKSVVYLGVSFVDLDLIEYAAARMPQVNFYIIGPHRRKSHDNVNYPGVLNKEQYEPYLERASAGISPLNPSTFNLKSQILPGYTGKIITYMKYLLPVAATNCSNYLNVKGIYIGENREQFCRLLETALDSSAEEREALREGYLAVMEEFLNEKVQQEFNRLVEG